MGLNHHPAGSQKQEGLLPEGHTGQGQHPRAQLRRPGSLPVTDSGIPSSGKKYAVPMCGWQGASSSSANEDEVGKWIFDQGAAALQGLWFTTHPSSSLSASVATPLSPTPPVPHLIHVFPGPPSATLMLSPAGTPAWVPPSADWDTSALWGGDCEWGTTEVQRWMPKLLRTFVHQRRMLLSPSSLRYLLTPQDKPPVSDRDITVTHVTGQILLFHHST